jgi:hypothetical protein
MAISDTPYGKFVPQENPVKGSYSIDPCVLNDNGEYYISFGGIWGGQLQRYRGNKAQESGGAFPADNEPALPESEISLLFNHLW